MRFEYFLKTLMEASLMWAPSVGFMLRFGVLTINVGLRQKNRAKLASVFNVDFNSSKIVNLIRKLIIKIQTF